MRQEQSVALANGSAGTVSADLSDDDIVDRVRGGCTDAFELLMRRHNQRLYRAVRAVLRDEAETEDVLQETYVRAFMHLDQFLGRARFATWLTRIAVHEALHRRQRRARFTDIDEVAETLASPSPGPERGAADGELRQFLEAAIDRLSADFRTVFVLRDVEGLSTAETAESLEIPAETVKTRLHRARRQLQQHLDRRVGESVREVFAFGFVRCDRLVGAVMERIGAAGRDAAGRGDAPAPDWSAADLYRTLVDDNPDAIVVADRSGAIRLWNAAAERLFGYSAAAALGRSLDLIIPEPQRERHWAGYDRVIDTGTSRYGSDLLKVPAVHRDGRRLSLEFRVQLLRGADGEVTGVAAFPRDVTEAWNERKALRSRIAELEAAAKR
jgi:RNA polymerase sigma-70 factor (ECF subfamily)